MALPHKRPKTFCTQAIDTTAKAILLCESDGTPEEVAEEIAHMQEVLNGCGATRIQVSRNEIERLVFWSGRKNAFPAAGRLSPDYYCMDGTIPRRSIGSLLRSIEEMEKKYQIALHQCVSRWRRQYAPIGVV